MKSYEIQTNLDAVQALAEGINKWARAKGFWDSELFKRITSGIEGEEFANLKRSQKLLLVITEIAELVEHLRKPAESSVPGSTNEEEEIADAIIRLLDYAGHYNLRIGDAIGAKMAKNEGRPFMHGKKF